MEASAAPDVAIISSTGLFSYSPSLSSLCLSPLSCPHPSIGGNCKTTMMAMISPALESFGESLSTLKFAHRAKHITNQARINEDVDEKVGHMIDG